MQVTPTDIDSVKIIQQFRADDHRGSFVKTFHHSSFKEQGIEFELKESFYSVSMRHVIRGMHFHSPPFDHDKIIFCTEGAILDVALDLRKSSNTYGQCACTELSFENNKAMYIPTGFAHGFITLSDKASTYYLVSGEYHPASDGGVRYDSFKFDWGVDQPIVSARDLQFESFIQFETPFL